jgi:hypothetical protein
MKTMGWRFLEKPTFLAHRIVVPTEPGFPDTLHPTRQRMRLSVKERRMKLARATNFNRKSGVVEGSAVSQSQKEFSPSKTYGAASVLRDTSIVVAICS